MLPQDIEQWAVRNKNGEMVGFDAFSSSYWDYGSPQLLRYSGAPAYEIIGSASQASTPGW